MFAANFDEIIIPANMSGIADTADGPVPICSSSEVSLGVIPTLDHQFTGEVVVMSDQFLEIRGFVFDGKSLFLRISVSCATKFSR
jgi:hypothetical protein